jgi:hypothetical protein
MKVFMGASSLPRQDRSMGDFAFAGARKFQALDADGVSAPPGSNRRASPAVSLETGPKSEQVKSEQVERQGLTGPPRIGRGST